MPETTPHRILLLANRTCPCPELHAFVHEQLGDPPGHVLVVAPALNDSRLAHWVSDSDEAVAAARERLALAVEGLEADGVTVEGVVGDAEPLQAIEDALASFPADAIVLSTHPPDASHWLEARLVESTIERLTVPVHHFVSEYALQSAPERAGRRLP